MLLGVVSSWAQVSFNVNAPSPVEIGERFRVEFTVDAEPDQDSFVCPTFEGFDVLAGPSTSVGKSVQYVNGSHSSSYTCTYSYVLVAHEAGKFTIDKATIEVSGKQYATKPLLIEVVDGAFDTSGDEPSDEGTSGTTTTPSRRGRDGVLLRWVLSDNEVYEGETVRASLMLYYYEELEGVANMDMDSFDNFWSQDLPIQSPESRAEYNGRVYNTYKLRECLLSPHGTGELSLPAATLEVVVLIPLEPNPRDLFFSRRYDREVRYIKTPPTTIKVKEFPAGAPASFNGAVGDFSMSFNIPEESINANSADEVTVTISGEGNLNFMTAPEFNLPNSFELYDTKVEESVQSTSRGVSGSIVYSYPFVARATGDFEVPPIEFSYFDPSTERYETLSTDTIRLNIVDDGRVAPTLNSSSATIGYGGAKILEKDIHYIFTTRLEDNEHSTLLFSNVYWIVVVLCVVTFVVVFVVMRQRIRANHNIVARRMKRADKVAIQRLRLANKYMKEGNRHAFYEETLRAMWGYISDKFNIPVANLTKETIREELTQRGVSSDDAANFCNIISRADEAQYAPTTDGDMSSVYMDAIDAISKIESVVKH